LKTRSLHPGTGSTQGANQWGRHLHSANSLCTAIE
jgi:hypothetical protein